MSTIGRLLTALFAALIFALMLPLSYWAAQGGNSFESIDDLLRQVGLGALIGAVLGLLFPKVFRFFFEAIINVSSRSSGL